MPAADVVIIGAGLAGLACARRLREIGRSFLILEAADDVGGRVRTDVVDGFRLDRGFQVLLTAYPECQRLLDYPALNLKTFTRGAIVRHAGKFHRFVDPRSSPLGGIGSLFGPIGTMADKLNVLKLEAKVRAGSIDDLFAQPEGLTLDYLRWAGFSDAMIDRFFRPFFGGIFLERDLVTSSRMFRFVFRMFAAGTTAVPALGMGEIPRQIAASLPADAIRLNAPVARVTDDAVYLESGERIASNCVVVATDGPGAARVLGGTAPKMRGVCCLYFTADKSPVGEPTLVLNADGGRVNNLAVMSDAARDYVPAGQALVSVSVLGDPAESDADLATAARAELTAWYGSAVAGWKHLRTYRIPHALPDQTAPALDPAQREVRFRKGLYVCGDHRDNASLNGAMASGWRAAQAVGADWADRPD